MRQRLGGEVETVGVLPVPDRQRTMSAWGLFIVWLMASASATTPLIGNLLYPYGLYYLIGAVVVAWLIGFIPAGLFSEQGREVPITALIIARRTFGWDGSFVLSVLFTLVNLGWFGLNTAVGGKILAGITGWSQTGWDWVVGLVQVVLVLFGMKWLERFYRYTTLILIVCYAALAGYLFSHYTVSPPGASAAMQWGPALTTVVTFSILAWTYKLSTTSRFCVPVQRTGHRASYFFAASAGIMISVLLMGVLGVFSQRATGNWNIALLGAHISGWGEAAAIGAALAILHTNAMNLYPSTVDLLVALNNAHRPMRWEQPLATLGLGVLGTVLAVAGILSHVQTFLNDAGDVIIPFTFIVLVDWFLLGRRRTPADDYYGRSPGPGGRLVVSAAVSFLVGFAISYWGTDFLPAPVYQDFPLPVFGAVVAALLYALLAEAPRALEPATTRATTGRQHRAG